MLWNVLGGRTDGGDVMAEVQRVDLQRGDRIVLCSDGLHRYVDEKRLAEIVTQSQAPSPTCRQLIEIANDAGGADNVTVIVSHPLPDDTTQTTWIDDFDDAPSRHDSLRETLPE